MKKLILGASALAMAAVALIGFGSMNAPTTSANPAAVYVINQNVATFLNSGTAVDLTTVAGRTAAVASTANLTSWQTGSAGQVSGVAAGGVVVVLVKTDGSTTNITLNGKGFTCTPACDGVATAPPDSDGFLAYTITALGTQVVGNTTTFTATQDAVTLDSPSVTVVGAAHDMQIAVTKATIQEKNPSCTITSDITDPTRGGAGATYTDINGKALAGYVTTWASDAVSKMIVSTSPTTISYAKDASSAPLAPQVYCGVAAGTANLNATTAAGAITGLASALTRTTAITVTGVPAAIALTASPATVACDGVNSSTVAAKVTDSAGNDVVDNTAVTFSVVALGTANPVNGVTTAGVSSSTITPLSTATQGVTVSVTAGAVTSQILVNCSFEAIVTQAVATATATGGGGGTISPPNTGTGGYLGQDDSSFPMWTLVALGLGSLALVGGGIVAKRSR